MIEDIIVWLSINQGENVYLGILILLILGGLGFPIPEDIPLILAGIAISKNMVSLIPMAVTCYIGVLLGDQFLYFLGYFFGKRLIKKGVESSWLPHLTQQRVDLVRERWHRRRFVLIIMARHLFPMRAATFVSAGTLHVPYLSFLIADAAAGLLSVAVMLALGMFIGDRLTPQILHHLIEQANYYLFGTMALFVAGYMLRRVIRHWRKSVQLRYNDPGLETSESSADVINRR